VRRVEVDQRGAERGQRGAGGDALRDPGGEQDRDVAGDDEQHQRRRLQRDRRGQYGPAAQVIG